MLVWISSSRHGQGGVGAGGKSATVRDFPTSSIPAQSAIEFEYVQVPAQCVDGCAFAHALRYFALSEKLQVAAESCQVQGRQCGLTLFRLLRLTRSCLLQNTSHVAAVSRYCLVSGQWSVATGGNLEGCQYVRIRWPNESCMLLPYGGKPEKPAKLPNCQSGAWDRERFP
jgi:hypothetical protein